MTRNASEVEQAVSRTLRDSLEKLQRTAEELNQAVHDLVSACASTRPYNSLPSMLRAQTAAASLAASLEVLSKFVTTSLQLESRSPVEQEVVLPSAPEPDSAPASQSAPAIPAPTPMMETGTAQPLEESNLQPSEAFVVADATAPAAPDAAPDVVHAAVPDNEPLPSVAELSISEPDSTMAPAASILIEELPPEARGFDVSVLPPEAQELHRRANRVAKVSMQDIKMLHPSEVGLGKEHKDLCLRLREDIERAHKEYDRRFHSILDHPVDYFYDWMVEILGDGNSEALGEYPYPSPVLRR